MQKKKYNNKGIFTISLDFELYWGMRDKTTIKNYSSNLEGVETAIDKILEAFNKYNIHATWATVGFLFYNDNNIKNNFPSQLPQYNNKNLNPYSYINTNNKLEEKYHYAQNIIEKILQYKNQEIATHTFSHYYCLEEGQTKKEFYLDIQQAIKTIKDKTSNKTYSLVFPRNQWNENYLSVLSELDIKCYRGNEKSWIYDAVNEKNNILLRRAIRLIDAYINISGHNTYSIDKLKGRKLLNIASSRFLRPVSKKLSFLEPLRLSRIKKSMTNAAKKGELFHLWWHPHNFGADLESNLQFLNKILTHFEYLNNQYNMQPLNMMEVALKIGNTYET